MIFAINGNDWGNKVAFGGFQVIRKPKYVSKTKMLDSHYRIATNGDDLTIKVTFQPLLTTETQMLFEAVRDDIFQVTYTDAQDGITIVEMTCPEKPYNLSLVTIDGREYWDGVTLTLEAR